MCSSIEKAYFDGVFVINDEEVAMKVEELHQKTNHVSICALVNQV